MCFSIALEASNAALAFCVPGLCGLQLSGPGCHPVASGEATFLATLAQSPVCLVGFVAIVLSGKGTLARPIETNFRRPSSVESVRDECATMKKQELAAPLNLMAYDQNAKQVCTTIMRYRTCEHYLSRFRTVSDTRTKAGASETRRQHIYRSTSSHIC